MKATDIRSKNDEELRELERDLRDRLLRLRVNKATNRRVSSAEFSSLRRDIARIQTVQSERRLGLERE